MASIVSNPRQIPDFAFVVRDESGLSSRCLYDVLRGRKVAVIFVPGAFTPTCNKHIFDLASKISDRVVIVAPNDADVIQAWRIKELDDHAYKLIIVADPDQKFAMACEFLMVDTGFTLRFSPPENRGLGEKRPNRVAFIVDNLMVLDIIYDKKKEGSNPECINNALKDGATGANALLALFTQGDQK